MPRACCLFHTPPATTHTPPHILPIHPTSHPLASSQGWQPPSQPDTRSTAHSPAKRNSAHVSSTNWLPATRMKPCSTGGTREGGWMSGWMGAARGGWVGGGWGGQLRGAALQGRGKERKTGRACCGPSCLGEMKRLPATSTVMKPRRGREEGFSREKQGEERDWAATGGVRAWFAPRWGLSRRAALKGLCVPVAASEGRPGGAGGACSPEGSSPGVALGGAEMRWPAHDAGVTLLGMSKWATHVAHTCPRRGRALATLHVSGEAEKERKPWKGDS